MKNILTGRRQCQRIVRCWSNRNGTMIMRMREIKRMKKNGKSWNSKASTLNCCGEKDDNKYFYSKMSDIEFSRTGKRMNRTNRSLNQMWVTSQATRMILKLRKNVRIWKHQQFQALTTCTEMAQLILIPQNYAKNLFISFLNACTGAGQTYTHTQSHISKQINAFRWWKLYRKSFSY